MDRVDKESTDVDDLTSGVLAQEQENRKDSAGTEYVCKHTTQNQEPESQSSADCCVYPSEMWERS